MPVGPLKRWLIPSTGVPFRARTDKTVLRHLERGSVRAHARAKIAHLGNRHAGIVGDNHRAGLREDALQLLDDFRLSGFLHLALLYGLASLLSHNRTSVTIRPSPCCSFPALSNEACPRVQTRTAQVSPCEFRFSPRLRWTFKCRSTPAVSDRFRRSSAGIHSTQCASALAAPTEPSAIFTPGPIVEEMEIFFM